MFVAGPAAGQAVEAPARAVVDQTAHGTEDRALDRECQHQLGQRDLLVLRLRCLFVILRDARKSALLWIRVILATSTEAS